MDKVKVALNSTCIVVCFVIETSDLQLAVQLFIGTVNITSKTN